MISRRTFLQLAATSAPLWSARRAWGFGERDHFTIAQVRFPGSPTRTAALNRLFWEIDKRTSIVVPAHACEIELADRELEQYPFLYLAGDHPPPPFRESDLNRLRRHLQAGGFLFIDSIESRPGGPFDRWVRQFVGHLLREPLVKLPSDHVIYKSFYLLHQPAGRRLTIPYLEGVEHDGRTAICYSQNDLAGAWARDAFGQWAEEVVPGGEPQREQAFRLGVNLAMYATCLDYKTDQVHVPFILRRRRWQP